MSTVANTDPTYSPSLFTALFTLVFNLLTGMGRNQKQPAKKPVVLILGGGEAGLTAAAQLEKTMDVILIDRRDHYYFHIGSPRATVDANAAQKVVIPYFKSLKRGHFIQGEVIQVNQDSVVLKGREGHPIKFDYLLLATGIGNTFPTYVGEPSAQKALEIYQNMAQAIQQSHRILVIGGGAVGAELLGELHEQYPNKQLTIVHPEELFISSAYLPAFRQQVTSKIKAMDNVTPILEDKVVIDDDLAQLRNGTNLRYIQGTRTVKTSKGKTIETDLIFFAVGSQEVPTNETAANVNRGGFLAKVFPDKVDKKGQAKVNSFLQVEGFERIFAAGDCTNAPDLKQVMGGRKQAAHAAANIVAHSNKLQLKEYSPAAVALFLPLGRKRGVGQLFGWVVGDWAVSSLKGKTYFIDRAWKVLHHPMPSAFDGELFKQKPQEEQVKSLAKMLEVPEEEARSLLLGSSQ